MNTQQQILMSKFPTIRIAQGLLLGLLIGFLAGCAESVRGCSDEVILKKVKENVEGEGGDEMPSFTHYVKKLKLDIVGITHDTNSGMCGAKVQVKAPTGNEYFVGIALAVSNNPGGGAPIVMLMGRSGFHELNADAVAYARANQHKFTKPEAVPAQLPSEATRKITETRPKPQDEAKELGSVSVAYASVWSGLSDVLKQAKGKDEAAFQEDMRRQCDGEADHAAQQNQSPFDAQNGCKAYLMKSRLKVIQTWK